MYSQQPLPQWATKIHSWPSFEIFQRQQELFDTTHKTYEVARMADSVKIVLIDRPQQKIIMIRDEQPDVTRITFAWGMVEKGENYIQAAQREVVEETGYHYNFQQDRFDLPYTHHRLLGQTHYMIARDLTKTNQTNPDRWSEKITLMPLDFDEFIARVQHSDNHSNFSYYICKKYILSGKIDELKQLFFG